MDTEKKKKRSSRAIGSEGEDIAAEYLRARGYRILKRSFRIRTGEIDIIAADGDILVFVEVKLRRSRTCGSPAEAIDRRKQAQIAEIARYFLSTRGLRDVVCRFDTVLISPDDGNGVYSCELVRDAFQVEEDTRRVYHSA